MRYALVVLLFCLSFLAHGQDTIVKVNGTVIAKVLELTTYEVKYKRFDNQDGPLYIELKSEIKEIRFQNGTVQKFTQENAARPKPNPIMNQGGDNSGDYFSNKYANSQSIEFYGRGFRYKGTPMNEKALYLFLNKTHDKEINFYVEKAKDARAKQYIGFGTIAFGAGTLYFLMKSLRYSTVNNNGGLHLNSKYLTYSGICLLGTIACPITSGYYRGKHTQYNRKAIELYNQKY